MSAAGMHHNQQQQQQLHPLIREPLQQAAGSRARLTAQQAAASPLRAPPIRHGAVAIAVLPTGCKVNR